MIKKLKTLLNEVEKHKQRIAKERDAIRELVEESQEILASCDEAEEDLEHAIDVLSQYL